MSKLEVSSGKNIYITIGVLTLIVFIGVIFLASKQSPNSNISDKPLLGKEIQSQGQEHVKRGEAHTEYNSNPPTSGYHWGEGVGGAGIHETEVPDELLVHSLEHGAVILSYKSDLSEEQLTFLKEAFNKTSGKKIMVPRKNLNVDVALTSWGRLQEIPQVNLTQAVVIEKEIKDFIETNSDKGPEKVSWY